MRRHHSMAPSDEVTAAPEHVASAAAPLADRVLAILIVHGDQPWQDIVAARLAERPADTWGFRLLVIDNGGAPSAADIAAKLASPVLHLTRPRTFGGAVAAGFAHPLAADAEFVVLLHDDLVLDADAVPTMVDVLDRRDDVAIAGPKLLDWSSEPVLQQVGMTIDPFGRAESHLHDGELDQGQHDHRDETLYVSSAGMLIRKDVFLQLGGFDPRFAAMRDDLDLCWRAWLAGYRVVVVPEAVAWHVSAAARSVRQRGPGRRATTRYLAERHTLAALVKNMGLLRLTWTLPIFLLLSIAKTVGFLLTRRVSSAAAPLAAIAWNVRSLPGTLRLRWTTQRGRRRSDAELSDLFARGTWRVRAYAETLADWARGTNTPALVADDSIVRRVHRSERSGVFRPVDALRDHPVLFVGGLLGVVWLLAVVPLLGRGQIIGGQVAAWPEGALPFFTAYTAGWGTGPLASGAFASPIQPVLGVLSAVVGGGAWLAQRLVVLGLVPLIWVATVRAGRLITASAGPRVIGATVYAASPLVLGAFAHGRLDLLTVAAALPGILLLAGRATQPGTPPGRAWRSTALLAIVITVVLAVTPMSWPVIVLVVCGVALLGLRSRTTRATVLRRLAVAALGAAALLLPWQLGLRSAVIDAAGSLPDPVPVRATDAAPVALFEAITGLTHDLPGMDGVQRWLWIGAAGAIVVSALVFGMRRRGGTVVLLSGAMVAFAGAAVLTSREAAAVAPPDIVMLPVVLALGALAVTAARSVAGVLSRHELGWRHAVASIAAVAALAGPTAVLWSAVSVGQWPGLRLEPQTLPLFVEADARRLGPYRVLLLEGTDAQIGWDVTESGGPTMTTFGAGTSRPVRTALDDVVRGLLAGDRQAVGLAGVLNVRYIVLRDDATRAAVAPAFADLAGVEPLAAGSGRVYEVRTWLPRAAVIPEALLRAALVGDPLPADAVEDMALQRVGADEYVGGPISDGAVVVSEARDPAWSAHADGRPLERMALGTDLPVNAFTLDADAQGVRVTAATVSQPWWLAWQVAALLLLVSLTLRAPGDRPRPVPMDPSAVPSRRRAATGAGAPRQSGLAGAGGSSSAVERSPESAGTATVKRDVRL